MFICKIKRKTYEWSTWETLIQESVLSLGGSNHPDVLLALGIEVKYIKFVSSTLFTL